MESLSIKDAFFAFIKAVFLEFFLWLWEVAKAGWGLIKALFGKTLYVGYWDGVWLTFIDLLKEIFICFFTDYLWSVALCLWDLIKALYLAIVRLYKE